ncbi:MAG: chromosome segregation SMC family protein, partial [Desulfomonilaceae bacterium]
MKLKRLEIIGFKSFPEKTTIDFCDGITSVVGPNGSGKSNIMEAIRWVMGEQRTRTLRCKKMEDLIFNGSDSLKPVGMAEIRLTLGNDGKSFPPPMSDYDEIMVTRRVYRDGNSQYEFNGVSCRLTDIVEFFLDTGIGRNSYAIIEQGRVEQIIAARPEERRIFLEEAASINRYKLRRESTIKKLEQTNQNLQRIKDVISEVKKQSQSLKKQAVKAERFRELKNRLRTLEISLEAFKCRSLSEKLNQLKVDERQLVDELTQNETNLGKLTAELESVRLQTSDIQTSFRSLSEKLRSTEVERNTYESNLNNCLSRENELRERRRRIESDLDSGIRNKSRAESKMEEDELKHSEFISSQTNLTQELKSSQRMTVSLEREAKEKNRRLEQFKEHLFETLQKLSQYKNRAEQNIRRQTEIKARLKKDEADLLS